MKLILFDVDGTICDYGKQITSDMLKMLVILKQKFALGIVGGGTYERLCSQIPNIWNYFTYVCSNNGNDIYKDGKQICSNDMRDFWGIDTISAINSVLLSYTASSSIYPKTGRFINLRKGLIYYVPIGHNCTKEERIAFTKSDNRIHIIQELHPLLSKITAVEMTIGGQLGIAIYPKGWGKQNVMKYIDKYDEVIYVGDKICEYGNDLPIAKLADKYHATTCYEETIKILHEYI